MTAVRKFYGRSRLRREGDSGFAEIKVELPTGHPSKAAGPVDVGVWSQWTVQAGLMAGWHVGVTRGEGVQEPGPSAFPDPCHR